jgi:hypothetical protein
MIYMAGYRSNGKYLIPTSPDPSCVPKTVREGVDGDARNNAKE